jgi:hypothetical protein
MTRHLRLLRTAAFAAALVVAGCAGEPVRLGGALPAGASLAQARDISAKACGFQLMLLIPIMINDRHERAYQALLAQAGPNAVTNVAIEESWSYAFVGTIYCTRLRAQAVPVSRAAAAPPADTPVPPPASESPPPAPAPQTDSAAEPPATPAVPASVPPAPAPVSPAMPAVLTAGAMARLRPDAAIRTRATADGAVVTGIDPGASVTLKASVKNVTGTWWYVTSPRGSGWVPEAGLEPATP